MFNIKIWVQIIMIRVGFFYSDKKLFIFYLHLDPAGNADWCFRNITIASCYCFQFDYY